MRTFAVINQKGGCGKTTTAINLAAAFAEMGRKTLLVDMDPQSHCALGLAVPESRIERCIAEALLAPRHAPIDWRSVVWQISGLLDLLPSTTRLAAVEHQLSGAPDRDLRLARLLSRVAGGYEACVIDCPPSIGLLTFNALRAAREVVIPVETGFYAMHGAVKQAKTLRVLADRAQHEVAFYVLPTMYEHTAMGEQIVRELREQFGDRVLGITIQYQAELKEAAGRGQPINEYDPTSRAARDYRKVAEHLMAAEPRFERAAGEPEPQRCAPEIEVMADAAAVRVAPVCRADVNEEPVGDRLSDLLRRAKALADRDGAFSRGM